MGKSKAKVDQIIEYEQSMLESHIQEHNLSSKWEKRPSKDGYSVRYERLFEGSIFQAVHARLEDETITRLMSIRPPEIQDDGQWTITKNPNSGYTVTSGFAISYGPFEWQQAMNDWLPTYGLGLISVMGYVQGEAYFSEVESGCFADALKRLHWLESFCVRVNIQVEKSCRRMWGWLDEQCRPDIAKMLLDPEELVDPPHLFDLMEPRSRERR